jgi:Myb-like DNA-binding protein FlbD
MPQHKRGPWSATEDQYLLHLVNLHGAHNWVRISSTIGTRSPKQCRERFHQNLKPNLNHDPITPEEGVLIEQMVAEMGKRWAEIARRLRGRSDNAVKNWWNGGMNRRRRSNNHRRQEVTVRQPVQQQTVPILNHPQMPAGFQQPQMQQQMPQQFFQQPMYQQQPQMQFPQHMSLPSNVHAMRHHGLVETPLPSPSTYSQMSADGAPSMVSDRSSISGRSPHNNGSPIELPPLSGNRGDRRQSAAPQLSLGTPNVFASDTDFSVPTMHITRYEDQLKQPQMLQEPFLPAQPQMYHAQQQRQFMQQPMQHMQQQMQPVSRQPSPMHQYQMQQQQQQHHQQQQQYHQAPMYTPQRNNSAYSMQQSPTDQSVQLPRIPDMAAPALDSHQQHRKSSMQLAIDPALMAARGTPVPSVHTPEGSPRDKMSLSNITL